MKRYFLRILYVLLAVITTQAFSPNPGGDSYEIYLNNKLLLKHYVGLALEMDKLPISTLKATDKLVFYYRHCGKVGKERTIAIVDEKGKLLKRWKFADASEERAGMVISASELKALQKQTGKLKIVYASKEIPDGKFLTALA